MYSEILIDDVFKSYKMIEGDEMKNLSRINIFIGKNNSGKSRFLRQLFSTRGFIFLSEKDGSKQISELLPLIKTGAENSIVDLRVVGRLSDDRVNNVANLEVTNAWKKPSSFNTADSKIQPLIEYTRGRELTPEGNVFDRNLNQYLNRYIEAQKLKSSSGHVPLKIYVPVLRGLRPIQKVDSIYDGTFDNYLERTKTDYFNIEIKNSRIVTGLHLYNETKKLLLGNLTARKKVRDFEHFISEAFFEGQEFSITPNTDDDVVHVRIGPDEKDEKPIHALGDGIQAIIILTYPLFFHEGEHAVICFEEPETHLHPGLQRLFIETLRLPRFDSFQYFITTHSNHFLDLTADYNDISIYTFSKKEDESEETFVIENVENSDGNVLQLIGARASSVFLSNCTIWVEGITDRLYLRKYLEVYQKSLGDSARKFKEDYHYSFVEYGGNNITHWSFLDSTDPAHPNINVDRLCAKLFLITDKDGAGLKEDGEENKNKSKKFQRHLQLQNKLGNHYHCLQCREIENLLTGTVIKAIILKREKKTELDFTQFDKADHAGKPLGAFIQSRVPDSKKKYEDKSGTLYDKLGFCKMAIEEIRTVADLSEQATSLTAALHNFIEQNNR